jgi:hypothetical protein
MKAGAYLFTVLAFGVLMANVVFAAHHHGHHAEGSSGTGQAGKDARGVTASPADQSSPRSKIPTKTGTSADIGTGTTPATDRGHPRAVTPGNGTELGGSAGAIDTRVTVHQGRPANKDPYGIRAAIKDVTQRLLKRSKSGNGAGTGQISNSHVHNQPMSPGGINGGLQRNAIGAIIERRPIVQQSGTPDPSHHHGWETQPTGTPGSGGQDGGVRGSFAVSTGSATKTPDGSASTNGSHEPQFEYHDPAPHGIVVAPIGGSKITGTGMTRPEFATGTLGGPAKTFAGVLNGTSFHARHP